MKTYLLAAALLLSTAVRPIRAEISLTRIATISALSSMFGAYIIMEDDGEDSESEKKGTKIAFAGASLAALVGILSNDSHDGLKVTSSCIAGYGPALGIMAVVKFLKNMAQSNSKKRTVASPAA